MSFTTVRKFCTSLVNRYTSCATRPAATRQKLAAVCVARTSPTGERRGGTYIDLGEHAFQAPDIEQLAEVLHDAVGDGVRRLAHGSFRRLKRLPVVQRRVFVAHQLTNHGDALLGREGAADVFRPLMPTVGAVGLPAAELGVYTALEALLGGYTAAGR